MEEYNGCPVPQYTRYPLPGDFVHRSRDDGQVLDRRGNPQVLGEEHRRFGNGDGRDFGAHEGDSTGS